MKIKDIDESLIKETTTAGAVASSMGGGNGFVNGGPGTLSRTGTKKTKKKKVSKRQSR